MADQVIQEIKDKLDIAQVLGEYLQLRRAGANFKALCPFHQEKTPSLMINRDRGIWRCFGCNEGGDIFSFIQKHEGLTFPETLKILADKAGVQLPERKLWQDQDKEAELRNDLLRINDLAAKYYHEALLRSQAGEIARKYLFNRGLKESTIKKWQLGFAPDDWHLLEKFLLSRGFSQEKMIQAGLLVRGEGGKVYDRFRFRVMFPLHDYHGRVVGFTARALEEGGEVPSTGSALAAKYINSPETPLYHKSSFLFGHYFAKNAIRQAGQVVVVEGNMDVISSHQAGVENVVASSGTALTVEQLNALSRLTRNLIFAFDSDKAGLSATRRGLEIALALGFKVRIVEITGGKDPDEIIKQDVSNWRDSLTKAPNFLDFSFDLIFGKIINNDKENLRAAARDFLEIVALLDDPIVQAQESKRVAEKLDVPLPAVLEELKRLGQKNRGFQTSTAAKFTAKVKTRRELLEERILGLAVVDSELRKSLPGELLVSDFLAFVSVADFVIKNPDSNFIPSDNNSESVALLQFIGEEELLRIRELHTESEKIKTVFQKLCLELKGISLRDQMKTLSRKISELEKNIGDDDLTDLRNKFSELSVQLSKISSK